MYLERKIDKFLIDWRNRTNHKPLIIKGARQVGKTESIIRFAQNYKNKVVINFIAQPQYKSITSDGYAPESIIKNISLIDDNARLSADDTLIVFDEIQAFPDIVTALKFFAIDGKYDVICSGSLLGINYKQIESNSVGYKEDYTMNSMDFEEFLWAKGRYTAADDMLSHLQNTIPFSATEMNVYSSLFKDFCITGGMPAIVAKHIETGTFEGVLNMQRQILQDYKDDIRKYVTGLEQTKILNVFNHIPVQLAKENKKFQISKVASGARFKDYWGCIEWLNDAGIINICYQLNFPELPIKGNYNSQKYKVYFKDTGLLIASLDEESQTDLRYNGNFGVYKGALYENIAADALIKCGYDTYYYKREDSTLEEDFFVRTAKSLVPIEIKAVNGKSKSMRTLLDSNHYPDITTGIKFCMSNVGFDNKLYTFPYFCLFLLKRYISGVDY